MGTDVKISRLLFVAAAALALALVAAIFLLQTAPLTVSGVVADARNGAPLGGVVVRIGDVEAATDGQGSFRLAVPRQDGLLAAALDGYHPAQTPLAAPSLFIRELLLRLSLQPVVVQGTVSDTVTGLPVAEAAVAVAGVTVITAADGYYRFAPMPQGAILLARADGYDDAQATFGGEETLPVSLTPNTVRIIVVDASDGQPIPEAVATRGGQIVRPASEDVVTLRLVKQGVALGAHADGYDSTTVHYVGGAVVTLTLPANTMRGAARDAASGLALAGITVTLQQAADTRTTQTGADGGFEFRRVRLGAVLTASGPEHAAGVMTYSGQSSLSFALGRDSLRGIVRDGPTSAPLAGASFAWPAAPGQAPVQSDAEGRFALTRLTPGAAITVTVPGHSASVFTYTGQVSIELILRPNIVRGVVRDGALGAPIAGASVSVGQVVTKTGSDGAYTLIGIGEGMPLIVSASGYDRITVDLGARVAADVAMQPFSVRAIFIPFYLLTVPERVRDLIDFADRVGMNAIVLDIKGDDGYIAYDSALPLAKEIGARWPGKMMSVDDVLALAKQRGLYTIARMVVFKDNLLALARPDLAVRDKRTNAVWDDCGNGSTYWADPFRKEVVEYNAGIAEEAARLGFDEIQFDYIRFPPACVSRVQLANASYAVTPTQETRVAAIETFLAEARRRVRPLGVALAIDTFGWTLLREDDLGIGQDMDILAKYVDYICPMVYPSTWEPGALGLDYVPAHPYEIVYRSIAYGLKRIKDIPGVKIRPWLQDFDDYQFKGLPYGVKELDEQRRGAADAGAVGWMLWNAGGVFTEETAQRP